MNDVRSWLDGLGLGEYAQSFEANRIDAAVLPHLTEQDLSNLGLPIGPRRKILVAIRSLNQRAGAASSLAAQRRHITVMFCDLVGSTALSERLDAEDLRDLIRAYQRAAGAAIDRYDGYVAQYLGDGLMSYFGWPAAHEDDTERAVRAALEVVEAVKAVAAPKPLQVRVGIASGPVVVGESGAGDASLPKLAVGETPNLAARLQGIAGPDEVVIAASTRRLVGAAFDLEDIGKQTLKGIAAPVHTWRVTGVAQAQGRFEAAHSGRLTPFVARESELALLTQRWQQVKNGEGQVVVVCGEPGIGKSRLAQMLREGLSGEPHAQLRYQCSPYHANSALYPVIEQLKVAAEFDRGDDLASKTEKMETLLRATFVDISAVAPLFAALLSLDGTERYPRLNLDPQRQKHETLKAFAGQIAALAAKQPVLMIFEDAHWIDPTTQQALDLIVPAIAGQRVLAVITSRPEYHVSWAGLAHLAQLPVTRFDRGQAGLMVQKLTGSKTLPKEVLEHIVVKTDGVPLFLEELTKTVLESSLLEEDDFAYHLTGSLPDFAIPFSLQDSLMARLDRLASAREIAQIGACIGRQFSHDLLAAVSGHAGSALDDALAQLVDTELVFHVRTSPSATYMFKHALVQDAAYNSLLRTHRATIHQRIGETLLAHFPEVAESAPETLAHHFTEGAMFEKAVGYWRIAAERASARYANIEAIGQYKKGLATCARLPDGGERVELELALRMGLIATLRMADRYDDALAELDRAESLAVQNNRTLELARIRHLRGNIYFPLGKIDQCLAEHQAALNFATQAHSTEDQARALGGIGDAHFMAGSMSSAHEHFDRCVALCRAHGLERIEAAYLPMRGTTYMYGLRFTEALDDCRASNEIATRSGHPRGEIISRNISCWTLLDRHDFAQSQQHARIALELIEKIGARRFVPLFNDVLARTRLHAGNRAGAIELLEDSLAISRETGITFLGPIVLGAIALGADEPTRRRDALNEGEAILSRGCVAHNYFWFYRDAIEASLAEGEWDQADAYAAALDTYFRAEPMPWADFIVARGRALAQLGRGPRAAALQQVRQLRDQAARLNMIAELTRLEAALDSVSQG